MEESRMRIGGAVVFWRLAKNSKRQVLEDGLKGLNLEEFTPECRTPLSCLRAALAEVFLPANKDERIVVRTHRNDLAGFAVAVERPKQHVDEGDAYSVVRAVVGLDTAGDVLLKPYDGEQHSLICDHMAGASGWVPNSSVSKSLTEIIESLGGVALRPNGGVYWLQQDVLDRWARISDVFEQASPESEESGPPNRVYALKVLADEQTARAVADMLADEVERDLSSIRDEIDDPDITPYRCERQLQKAAAMSGKVMRYRESLGPAFAKISESIELAAGEVARATLKASVAAAPEVLSQG